MAAIFIGAVLLAIAATSAAREAPAYWDRLPQCSKSSSETITLPCVQRVPSAKEAISALKPGQNSFWRLRKDELTMIARPGGDGWAILCCGIQTPLEPIGDTGLAGIVVRVPRMNQAFFDIGTSDSDTQSQMSVYRGPDAPPAPAVSKPLRGILEHYAIDSRALGESHQGIIYIPPSLPAGIRVPVIYLADGDTPHYAPILEAAIRDGRSAPAIIVGIEPGQGPVKGCTTPCDRRMLEYVIDLNPEGPLADDPFGRYLRFVTDELIPYVESRYPASSRREDRVTAGYSNGGAWALAAAEARPDLFGKVLAMSSVSKAVIASVSRLKNVRVYAGDGLLEGGSHRTPQTAAAAKRAGADVKFRQFVAGHSTMLFDMLFSEGISWLLPAPPRR